MAITIKIEVFWCVHRVWQLQMSNMREPDSFIFRVNGRLKMEAVGSPNMLVFIYQTTLPRSAYNCHLEEKRLCKA
jgi:hypothetical protein